MFKRMLFALCLLLLVAGCTAQPTTDPAPVADPAPTAKGQEPAAPAEDWPRQVTDAHGRSITIRAKPMRIHTLSIGYDEITMALVGAERFAAVGTVTANPLYSNIVAQAEQVPLKVGRKSEDVLGAQPDLVLASPFANKDLVQQLQEAGLTVVVSNLQSSVEGHASNIRFLAHLYGEEERGEALIAEVEARLERLEAVIGQKAPEERPLVISLSDTLNTPGAGTTMGGIIQRAGGRNAAAEAGIDQWQQITLEKVVELSPEVILVTDGAPDKPNFGKELLAHPSLQSVPAIQNGRVYSLPDRLVSTLSHWNIRGAEELARILWPEEFADVQFVDFDW